MKTKYKRMVFDHSMFAVPRPWVSVIMTSLLCSMLPFFAIGGFFIANDKSTYSAWVIAIFLGFVFIFCYFTLIYLSYSGTTKVKNNHEICKEHDESPWMWKEQWRNKCVKTTTFSGFGVSTFVAILGGAFILIWIFSFVGNLVYRYEESLLSAFFSQWKFLIFFFGYLAFIYYIFIQQGKIRFLEISLDNLPVSDDYIYEGKVHGSIHVWKVGGIELTLSCCEVTDRQDNSPIIKKLWELNQTHELSEFDVFTTQESFEVPFSFSIPDGLPETNEHGSVSYEWFLKMHIPEHMLKSKRSVEFETEVPVFFEDFPDRGKIESDSRVKI